MKLTKISNTIMLIAGIVIYKILLEYIYISHISEVWSYSGFVNEFSFQKYLISWTVVVLYLFIIKINFEEVKPSNSILIIFYFIAFIPAIILTTFIPTPGVMYVFLLLYWFIVFSLQHIIPKFKYYKPNYKESVGLTYFFLFLVSLTVIYVSYKYTGFRINLNLLNVYELREEARLYNMPTLISYIYSASRVLIPTLILYFFYRKKYNIVIILILLQVLVFSVDGSKSVIFSLVLAITGYLIFRSGKNIVLLFSFIIINLIAIMEKILLNTTYIIDVFIRRLIFLPQLLNYYYFDYFNSNDKDFFRQSFMGDFGFDSPYLERIPAIIGNTYYGSFANNGLFSDAYYNLGWIGIILLPILLVVILRTIDVAATSIPPKIFIAAVITTSLNLISSSVFTVLTSHGVLAVMLVLYFLPKSSIVK